MNKMPLNLCQNIFPNYSGDTFIDKRDYNHVYIMFREPEREHHKLKLDSKLMREGKI
jgi:hypothetical protein